MLKHPQCKVCQALRDSLPTDVSDKTINDYHDSKGSYELFPKRYQDIVIEIMLELNEPD